MDEKRSDVVEGVGRGWFHEIHLGFKAGFFGVILQELPNVELFKLAFLVD